MARARMWEKRSILGIRQGGNGMAQILGVWENNVPHGKGKATFVMGRDYDKDNDPFKWDMYDACYQRMGWLHAPCT